MTARILLLISAFSTIWAPSAHAEDQPSIIPALLNAEYNAPANEDTKLPLLGAIAWNRTILSPQVWGGQIEATSFSRVSQGGIDAIKIKYSSSTIEATVRQSSMTWVADITVLSPQLTAVPNFNLTAYIKDLIKPPAIPDTENLSPKKIQDNWFTNMHIEPLSPKMVRVWTLKARSGESSVVTTYDLEENKIWFIQPKAKQKQ